jgi:subtilisin family serine protease
VDPALVELFNAASEGEEVEVLARLRQADQVPVGFRVVAQFENIVTGRVVRERMRPVWADDKVASLKAPRAYYWNDDLDLESSTDTRPWPGDGLQRQSELASGRGVVVGVCDWALDFVHDDFRNPDGSTRVLALWDQGGREGQTPEPYGYGRVIYRSEIDAALQSSTPYETLGYGTQGIRQPTHGTHVTGIAAGNGRGPSSIRSAAYEAELVFVHMHAGRTSGLGNLGDSVRLLEAIDFVRRTAGSRPWVCNCSLGRTGGPHDGSTLVEQGIDSLVQQPGCAVVMSAGNYHSNQTASTGKLRPGLTTTLGWTVSASDPTKNELELWYSAQDDLVVRLKTPDGNLAAAASLGERMLVRCDDRECGRLYHRACDPNNGDHHIDIFLDPGAPGGRWSVELEPVSVRNGRYHAWIERDLSLRHAQSTFAPEVVSTECTTGTICNGKYSIAVGAVDTHQSDLPLGRFSSGGRLRDGRQKPDLVAPGVQILSARSAPSDAESAASGQSRMSGTSMAAPHVTGAIAAMMQAAGRPLRIEETRRILFETATAIARPRDALRSGAGMLDLDGALRAAHAQGRGQPTASVQRVTSMRPSSEQTGMPRSSLDEITSVWLPLSGSVGLRGNNGAADVLVIQRRLVELRFLAPPDSSRDRGGKPPDAGFDAATERALASFQQRVGLPVEPLVVPGSATHRLLMRPGLPAPRLLHLSQPVGEGWATSGADADRVWARLGELGFAEATTSLPVAIARFQGSALSEVTGCVRPGSLDERVLNDPTFGTLSMFPKWGETSGARTKDPLTTLLQQTAQSRKRGESVRSLAPEAGVPFEFGVPGLTGPAAVGALARFRGRVESTLSQDGLERLAQRVARIGALFDELERVHLPSDARTPLREVARSLLPEFDARTQEQTGLFPGDLLRILRAQRAARSVLPGSGESFRSERSAFQTKGLLTGPQGQTLRELMSGGLSAALAGAHPETRARSARTLSA